MSEKLLGMRWLPMSAGAMVLTTTVLFGPAYGAAASTAHRGILLPGHPARSMAPGTSLLSSCSAGDGGACNQMALTAIEASCALATGAGHATAARGYRESDTVLMVGVCGHAPTDVVFTWAKAKKLLHIR
jgi:hypothetical protein